MAAANKSRPSEDSDEEQKMEMNEENDDSDVVLVEEVKSRKKLVKRVMSDAERGISMVKLQASSRHKGRRTCAGEAESG